MLCRGTCPSLMASAHSVAQLRSHQGRTGIRAMTWEAPFLGWEDASPHTAGAHREQPGLTTPGWVLPHSNHPSPNKSSSNTAGSGSLYGVSSSTGVCCHRDPWQWFAASPAAGPGCGCTLVSRSFGRWVKGDKAQLWKGG